MVDGVGLAQEGEEAAPSTTSLPLPTVPSSAKAPGPPPPEDESDRNPPPGYVSDADADESSESERKRRRGPRRQGPDVSDPYVHIGPPLIENRRAPAATRGREDRVVVVKSVVERVASAFASLKASLCGTSARHGKIVADGIEDALLFPASATAAETVISSSGDAVGARRVGRRAGDGERLAQGHLGGD